MLFSSSTDAIGQMGSVAISAFDGVGTYVILLIGIVLGFFIIERLITAIFPKAYYGDNQTKDV